MKKSFKYLTIAAMAISIIACKKKEEASLIEDNSSAIVEHDSMTAGDHTGHNHEVDENASLIAESQKNPITTVVLKESDYSFGQINHGDVVEHTYEITNTGSNPLIISSVKPGCGCTAPDYTKEPILPGKTGKVTLKFDSNGFSNAVAKGAEIFANVEKAPIRIGFTAEIK